MIFKVKQLEENISFLIFLLVFMVLSFIHSIIKYKVKNKLEETQRGVEQSHSNSEAQVRSLAADPSEINIKYISKRFKKRVKLMLNNNNEFCRPQVTLNHPTWLLIRVICTSGSRRFF